MGKRILSVLLILILTMTFAACGVKPQGQTTGDAAHEGSTPSSSVRQTETGDEARVATRETEDETQSTAHETKDEPRETTEAPEVKIMQMKIGETVVFVEWEQNESVDALKALVSEQLLTIQMSMYGGFEQVGSIGQGLPRDDKQTTTRAGDIVLYSGNQRHGKKLRAVFYVQRPGRRGRMGCSASCAQSV